MHLNLFPSTILIILIIFISSFNVPPTLCVDDFRYTNCSQTISCGDIENNFYYPFWGGIRPDYCGRPGYELKCQNDVPRITMMQNTFRVIDMNFNPRILKVARDDYWGTVCPQQFINTTVNFTLFDYASGLTNLTIFYGCSKSGEIPQPPTPLNCTINGTEINAYYVTGNITVERLLVERCNNSVIIPIYESGSQALELGTRNITDVLDEGFELVWKVSNECNICRPSGGRCGYNTTTNQFACFCNDQPSNTTTCLSRPQGSSPRKRNAFVIAISLSVAGSMAAVIVAICVLGVKRKLFPDILMVFKKNRATDQIEAFINNYGALTLKRYSYADVKRLTNSFTDKLGKGGFGAVYKGKLPDGRLVAVKVLSESKGNGEEFINEVASIGRTSHVNVVTLVGFCYEKTKRALIYEFMPKGSLDKFICDQDSSNTDCRLEWKTLYQIAVGIARGLEYLHRGCNTRILHFDIKPHNILLDENFCPKISDFGLAKLCKREESTVSMLGARGTIGYIAPEVFSRNFGGVSHKSDVYSYGMMVIEMVGGRKNFDAKASETNETYFSEWIYKQLEPGEDFKLNGVMTDEDEEIARKMIVVSMCCVQTIPSHRPSMTKVVEMLEGSLQSLQIPPMPFLSSPPRLAQPSSMISSSSSSSQSATLMGKKLEESISC